MQQILLFSYFWMCGRGSLIKGFISDRTNYRRSTCPWSMIKYWHYWVYSSFTEKVQHNWITKFKLWKFSLTPEVVFLLNCPDAGNYPDPSGKDNQKQIDKWKIMQHWQGKLLSKSVRGLSNINSNLLCDFRSIICKSIWWHWCSWQCYVADFMMVTHSRWWLQNCNVGNFFPLEKWSPIWYGPYL